ncbi:restriction endonuclease [Microbulbifer sp. SSSA002]|uniref:restriction endonuclease n=1 Tax=Microbulbifer sp. SSSA002 TaxID=3243376 RepID=UPI004039F6E3
MEAKCYAINNGVGVKELSRLISRLRHRQFGVLVITSYLASQAYKELKSDEHPVVVLSAIDIARLLLKKLGHLLDVQRWLEKNY